MKTSSTKLLLALMTAAGTFSVFAQTAHTDTCSGF